jgi:surface polysaccharide O-acyltransferase-like enzyme
MNIQENRNFENHKENKSLINSNEINKNIWKESTLKINKRIEYFDWLRILCCFSVIVIHISAKKWNNSPIISHEWKIFNFYNSIVRFGVPIFFMISGTIFLEKDLSFNILLNKYIKNIYIKLLFWSFFYSLRKKNNS